MAPCLLVCWSALAAGRPLLLCCLLAQPLFVSLTCMDPVPDKGDSAALKAAGIMLCYNVPARLTHGTRCHARCCSIPFDTASSRAGSVIFQAQGGHVCLLFCTEQ